MITLHVLLSKTIKIAVNPRAPENVFKNQSGQPKKKITKSTGEDGCVDIPSGNSIWNFRSSFVDSYQISTRKCMGKYNSVQNTREISSIMMSCYVKHHHPLPKGMHSDTVHVGGRYQRAGLCQVNFAAPHHPNHTRSAINRLESRYAGSVWHYLSASLGQGIQPSEPTTRRYESFIWMEKRNTVLRLVEDVLHHQRHQVPLITTQQKAAAREEIAY